MKKTINVQVAWAAVAAIFLFAVGNARAHSIGADAYVGDGLTVHVESWIGTDHAPPKGEVTVLLPDGSVYTKGKLEDGKFSFRPKTPAEFKFVVDFGSGHGKTFTIHPEELEKLRKKFQEKSEVEGRIDAKDEIVAGEEPDSAEVVRKARAHHHGDAGEDDLFLRALLGLLLIGQAVSLLWIWKLDKKIKKLKGDD